MTSSPGDEPVLSDAVLDIVRFCAIECEMQWSGERSVWWMLEAWHYAEVIGDAEPTLSNVISLGMLVEPKENARGFRKVPVQIGWDVKRDWQNIPHQMESLMANLDALTPAEFFKAYEEVHPFVDGNGRTGQILFNWLNGSLASPVWAPNFWGDPRRVSGDGAPSEDAR